MPVGHASVKTWGKWRTHRKITGWLTSLVLLCGLFVFTNANLHSQSDAPYLYYHSIDDNAFIIERADGTDRRVLTPFQLPSTINAIGAGYVVGPGWSSSGNWFVWSYWLENAVESDEAFLVNHEGNISRQIIDGYVVEDMLWHPTRDLLLLHILPSLSSELSEALIQIYDPNQDEILLEVDAEDVLGSPQNIYDIWWSPDGRYIILWNTQLVKIIDLEGDEVASLDMAIRFNDRHYGCQLGELPFWIDDQTIAYTNTETSRFIIENLDTGREIVNVDLSPNTGRVVDVSPNGQHILIYAENPSKFPNYSYSLWYVSLENSLAALIRDDVYYSNNCADQFLKATAWRNDEQAVFLSPDEEIFLYSVESNEATRVPVPIEGNRGRLSPIRWSGDEMIFVWMDTTTPQSTGIYTYDVDTTHTSLLADGEVFTSPIEYFSPVIEEQFIAWDQIVSVSDDSNRLVRELTPNIEEFQIQEVKWSPLGDWFILLRSSVPYGLMDVRVVPHDGSSERALAVCLVDAESCYGWLP